MFTRNIKDTFTQGLLNAVAGVLGEAKKKCSEGCECEACVAEKDETNEGYVNHAQRKAVWANRADDGKGHPDKKKKMKEEVDVEEMVNEAADGLADKAKKSGVSLSVLKKVYSRGIAAWNTGHRPGTTPQQWAHARVNSYISKGKGTYHGADKDLRSEGYEDRKEAGKLGNQLKREHEAKEKKEPNGVKEAKEDVPFKGPYKKAGQERKDEYGNKVKNVAKYLAKKAMNTQKEEVEEIEEAGLWANIHAKRKRIKAGSGERMRNVGEKGAPTPAGIKSAANEAFEQIDEISAKTVDSYRQKAYAQQPAGDDGSHLYKKRKAGRDMAFKKVTHGAKVMAKEDIEELDEAPFDADSKTHDRHYEKQSDRVKNALDNYARRGMSYKQAYNKIRHGGTHVLRHEITAMHEESEQIDELSKKTLGSYVKKAANQSFSKGVSGGLALASRDPEVESQGVKIVNKAAKRMMGVQKAADKLTKEEQDFIDALNNDTLDEARGRPRKAGAKDFTINPKTKEKLMHNNPEHMKKIEALQRNGVIQAPKIEANQHIIQQLQRAKLSMRGGEIVNFTHGDSQHVAGHHAAKLLTRYAGMKPDEKEAFQKKIGHSHANLKSEL
jgi:hypothetical protein